jgi:hypothetical protein
VLALVEDWRPEAFDAPLAEQESAIQLMLDLEAAGMVTPVGLTLTDPNLPYSKAEALAVFWGSVNRRCAWYIGDFLLYCEQVFGEEYPQIVAATGLTEQTCMHRMFVCKNVPLERRVPGLGFAVHALVARKPAHEQAYWLNEAAKHGWGYVHLRDAMAGVRREEQPTLPIGGDGDLDDPEADEGGVNIALLLEAAQALIRDAQDEGEFVKVPVESFARLRAAFDAAL